MEAFNPGDREIFHAVFVGGVNMPARVRVFVDYMVERWGDTLAPSRHGFHKPQSS
jgi:hypothetical protein